MALVGQFGGTIEKAVPPTIQFSLIMRENNPMTDESEIERLKAVLRRIAETECDEVGASVAALEDAAREQGRRDCVCSNYETPGKVDPLCPIHAWAFKAGRREENEACAKVAEDTVVAPGGIIGIQVVPEIAAAIRSRMESGGQIERVGNETRG